MRRQSERCKNISSGLGKSSISIRGPFLPCTRHLPHCAHSAYRPPCYSEAFICEKRLLSHGGSIFYNPTHTVYILSCPYRIVNSNDLLFRLICAVRPVEVSTFRPLSLPLESSFCREDARSSPLKLIQLTRQVEDTITTIPSRSNAFCVFCLANWRIRTRYCRSTFSCIVVVRGTMGYLYKETLW